MDKECSSCFKIFTPKSRHKECPKCRAENSKISCPTCENKIKRSSSSCVTCFNDRARKYKIVYHAKGYTMTRVKDYPKNNGYKFLHVLAMEELLGRELLPNENVHHINGIRDDNRIENLELWTKHQPSGIRVVDAVEWAELTVKLYNNDSLVKGDIIIESLDVDVKLTERQVTSRYNKKGYIMCNWKNGFGKNSSTFEHVIVMSEHIGRDLLPHENVHHINGIKDDNRIENLELWTKPQPSGIRAKDALKWANEILKLYK